MEKYPRPDMEREGGIGARFVALIVDAILIAVVVGILGVVVAATGSPRAIASLSPILGLVGIAYYIYMEGAYGYTIGKKVMGLVVVKEDGSDCDMVASLIRNVLRIVDGLFLYLVGVVVILLTEKGQRIGDLAGDTVVVKEA